MNLLDLAEVLASTDDHPRRGSRVLYLTPGDGGLEPAGFADTVGDVTTVLDRLDTEGADGLAVQAHVVAGEEPAPHPVAVVADRTGGFAMVVAGEVGAASDHAPRPDDPAALQQCWRFVVHALAALDRAADIPEPPDDPHPAAYLMAAWLATVVEAAKLDPEVLDQLESLPDEAGLVGALGLPPRLRGWDAVHAAAMARSEQRAHRLGRNGTAWQAHVLLGDPAAMLSAVADAGRVELADALFAQLIERGWARPAGPA